MAVRERAKPYNAPKRAFSRDVVAVATVTPTYIAPVAALVQARIMTNRKGAQCAGSWVYGREDGAVFVIRDGSPALAEFQRRHSGWSIGFYAGDPANGQRASIPTIAQLTEDIGQHMQDLGLIRATVEQTGGSALIAA